MKGRVSVWERRCWISFAWRLNNFLQPSNVQGTVFAFEGYRGELEHSEVNGVRIFFSVPASSSLSVI